MIDNVRALDPYGKVVVADRDMVGRTKGAMETLSRALRWSRPAWDEPLVIANCDQILAFPERWPSHGIGHGVIFTFKSASRAHSYVTTDEAGRITGIVEKPYFPPTDQAVSGVYYFVNPSAITAALRDCQERPTGDKLVTPEGEQYLSRALARMIDQDYALYAVQVPTAILGTPEDFQRFETALAVLEWDALRSRA